MFSRILIANRGEIAVRVIRACREMGIESVAVYSDADAAARHVTLSDHAVRIGTAAASDSYLSIERVIAAATQTGANAVHPGYGFLSESAQFATACADAGVTFIGPSPRALSLMGSKIAARRVAQEAGAPVVPGEVPVDQTDDSVAAAVRRMGFPALLKPSEGGGGIGMEVVLEESALRGAIERARRTALAAFGDGTLYVERLVQRPRHIEIQVLADGHGNVIHLFERECSLQRRHQKVIEESPSVVMTPALRQRMGDAAVAIARAAGYENAGTVEFLLGSTGSETAFYFLEMNTRLQVEHPVTEAVTGIDLVRAQIAIAAGERLAWTQADVSQRGHAIEARIYAEAPGQNDLPQAGPLLLYREPVAPGIRIDSGVSEGDEVTVHYDPLLAKLIASAETRDAARRRAIAALRNFPVLGISTNVPLLIELLEHPRFIAGDLDTGFLDAERSAITDRLAGPAPPEVEVIATAVRSAATSGRVDMNAPGPAPDAVDPWSALRTTR
jgi:acetyl/propionyl-CoA carboxylase alpha subunit